MAAPTIDPARLRESYHAILQLGMENLQRYSLPERFGYLAIEIDHLHNLPAYMNQDNVLIHAYYYCTTRPFYLERLAKVPVIETEYLIQDYQPYWRKLRAELAPYAAAINERHYTEQIEQRMRVEIWLDVSCPWCRGALPVMKRLLEEEAAGAEIAWRPIRLHRLDPEGRALPELGNEVLSFNLERGRELAPERLQWLHHPQVAHRLLALCRDRGDVDMWGLAERLWEANWVQGIDIGSVQALSQVVELPGRIWQQLNAGVGDQMVEADHRRALQIGLDGVPRFYVNGTIVPAWLEVEVVRDRLRAALRS